MRNTQLKLKNPDNLLRQSGLQHNEVTMELIKSIKNGSTDLNIWSTGSTWFFTFDGKYDNGTTYSDAYGAYDTERKAMNAMKKYCKAANIEFI